MEIDVRIYQTQLGKRPFTDWYEQLKDTEAKQRIRKRIRRVGLGHFGDTKPVGEGVYEMRFFFGSGYRVYYGLDNGDVILLLCGGDKSSQSRDIENAKRYWNDYKENNS